MRQTIAAAVDEADVLKLNEIAFRREVYRRFQFGPACAEARQQGMPELFRGGGLEYRKALKRVG